MSAGYELSYGTHANPQDGRCAMEWVSFLAGEEHSDEPACVSPVLRVFCIALNDRMDDLARQRLRPVLGALQESALGLLDRMLPTVAVAVAEAAPRARSGSRQGVY